jgi:hypothetical protein
MFMRATVDQRAAGDLDPFQVSAAQLSQRERVGQRAAGEADQFGSVPRKFGGLVVFEVAAARDDLEMGRVAHRPAQISETERAKPRQRVAVRHFMIREPFSLHEARRNQQTRADKDPEVAEHVQF